jgi:hypothetical protein
MLELVGVQEVRWDRIGTEPHVMMYFSMEICLGIVMGSDKPGSGICPVLGVGIELILHN